MRILSNEEQALVAGGNASSDAYDNDGNGGNWYGYGTYGGGGSGGGFYYWVFVPGYVYDDNGTPVVTASGGHWEYQPGDGSGSGGGSGGTGGTGGGGMGGPEVHETPAHHQYTIAADLTSAQEAIIGKIIDYGMAHNRSLSEIRMVVNQAFYESSLGALEHNPTNSSVAGLFQYDAATWDALGHSDLNRMNDDDQIVAMFQDLFRYEFRYVTGQLDDTIPDSLSLDDYFEIKHHLGNNSTDWGSSVVTEYEQKTTELGLGF
jgi:hypothetical protein